MDFPILSSIPRHSLLTFEKFVTVTFFNTKYNSLGWLTSDLSVAIRTQGTLWRCYACSILCYLASPINHSSFTIESNQDIREVEHSHCLVPIHDAIIISAYLRSGFEPVLRDKYIFVSNATSGHRHIPLVKEDEYRPAFLSALSQFCYKRIGQVSVKVLSLTQI